MTHYHDKVQQFEAYLGSLHDQNSPCYAETILDYDEKEILPWPFLRHIQNWGYAEYLIPKQYGGELHDILQLYFLTKCIAKRDAASAILMGLSYFASLPIWIAGSKQQIEWTIQKIRSGEIAAYALTEINHGSDISANETNAVLKDDHYILNGDKWAINHAKDSYATLLLVKTTERSGPLSHSLILMDKSKVRSGLHHIDRLHTHGARSLLIGGYRFENMVLPKDCIVGREGHGLALTYNGLQISRTLCAAMSCGTSETALSMAIDFALKRQLYGQEIIHIPMVTQRLSQAYVRFCVADIFATCVMRAASYYPERLSLWSAMVKFFVPHHAEYTIDQCAKVLGARAFIRSEEYSLFQKIRRDNQLIGLFDGSGEVNLTIIANHLIQQAQKRQTQTIETPEDGIYQFTQAIPEFDYQKVVTFSRHIDAFTLPSRCDDNPTMKQNIDFLYTLLATLDEKVIRLKKEKRFNPQTLELATLSEDYCWIICGFCAVRFYLLNPELPHILPIVELYIQLIKQRFSPEREIDMDLYQAAVDVLIKKHRLNQPLSLLNL